MKRMIMKMRLENKGIKGRIKSVWRLNLKLRGTRRYIIKQKTRVIDFFKNLFKPKLEVFVNTCLIYWNIYGIGYFGNQTHLGNYFT